MATSTIPQLQESLTLQDTWVFPVDNGEKTYKVQAENLKSYVLEGLSLTDLSEIDFSTPPEEGDTLVFDGTNFAPSQITSGSGSGETNYLTNFNFEKDTQGWLATAGNLSRTTDSAEILRGTGSLKWVVAASGDKLTALFNIPRADENKMIKLAFPFDASGSFDIYIVKDPNGTPVTITPNVSEITTGRSNFFANFLAQEKGEYQLVIEATGDASDYIIIDDSVVGPGKQEQLSADTDDEPYTPSVTTVGGASVTPTGFQWYRRKNRIYVHGGFIFNGTASSDFGPTMAELLPSGLTLDTAAYDGPDPLSTIPVGQWSARDESAASGVDNFSGIVELHDLGFLRLCTGDNDYLGASKPFTWDTPDQLAISFSVPIQQWRGSGSNLLNIQKQSPVRAGIVTPYAGATAPEGWLLCDGSEVSQTVYADLFSAIGTTWNTCAKQDGTGGNWSAPSAGNFRLPDLRGVFLRGVGTSSDSSGARDVSVTLGGYLDDTYQNHSHNIYSPGGIGTLNAQAANGDRHETTTRGTLPSGSTETRGRSQGVNYIIKAFNDSVDLAGFGVASEDSAGLIQLSNDFVATETKPGLVNPYGDSSGVIYTGTYTPSFTGGTNGFGTPTPQTFSYTRVGKTVSVSGQIRGFPLTTTDAATRFDMTIPITTSTNLTHDRVAGTAAITNSGANSLHPGVIDASPGNTTHVRVFTKSASTTSNFLMIQFTYELD